MSTRTRILGALVSLVALVVIAGGLIWYFVIRSDPPPPANIETAVENIVTPTASSTAATSATSAAATGTTSATPTTSASGVGITGTWTIDATQASYVGYRVEEQLARIGANTAVGRTSAVTGQVVIAGDSATMATFEADLTQLKSDSNQRDGQLKNQAIQTSKFPKATFELTSPVAIPDGLASGQQVSATLSGNFTLHGVTKAVAIPVEAQVANGLLVVVGSIDIKFSDYNVSQPNGASVLSIDDHGTMELQLYLKPA